MTDQQETQIAEEELSALFLKSFTELFSKEPGSDERENLIKTIEECSKEYNGFDIDGFIDSRLLRQDFTKEVLFITGAEMEKSEEDEPLGEFIKRLMTHVGDEQFNNAIYNPLHFNTSNYNHLLHPVVVGILAVRDFPEEESLFHLVGYLMNHCLATNSWQQDEGIFEKEMLEKFSQDCLRLSYNLERETLYKHAYLASTALSFCSSKVLDLILDGSKFLPQLTGCFSPESKVSITRVTVSLVDKMDGLTYEELNEIYKPCVDNFLAVIARFLKAGGQEVKHNVGE